MRSDGILGAGGVGGGGSDQNRATSAVESRRRWLKRRETWLVLLGVALHAVYMLSIFDIYFKTPIVHGMDPVPPRFSPHPPAKRLILLISDGLRADKFYEPDVDGNYRAPFLRNIIKNQGRWGVSHARPPTESRPGHVAIIAGFYEDPSAVTKGWKANPVEFDSVFNQSRHTFAYGSPDIIPIFCSALPHSTWNSYPHEYEDFATGSFPCSRFLPADASFLDEWSFDQFESLLNRSHHDPKLKQLLHQDKLVFFLHLLGCDSNGHAHRPYSSIYLNNVKVVDKIAERVYHLLEDYYRDNRTSYIFTADHGMSDKGSHGDGHPTNTDTPLVAWGAGIKYPRPATGHSHSDSVTSFVDKHAHDMPTPYDWGLNRVERVDVNQADIAPLMSTLLGLPCPVNSVGNLPLGYMKLNEAEEVEAVLANTKQILNQLLRKSHIKMSNSLFFKPFKPLVDHSSSLSQIDELISAKRYEAAMKLAVDLRNLSLEGLHYFQTYDWLMLMTVITLGYTGWMIVLALHVLQCYSSLSGDLSRKGHLSVQKKDSRKVYLSGCLLMAILTVLNLVEHSPPLYHAYIGMTVFLWTQIFSEYRLIRGLWIYLRERKAGYFVKLLFAAAVAVVIVELLVHSFTERKLYTWFFLIAGFVSSILLHISIPWRSGVPVFVCISCWFLSVFTLMPAEIPDNNNLVCEMVTMLVPSLGCRVISGAIIIVISLAAKWLDTHAEGNKFWQSITFHESRKPMWSKLYFIQIVLVGVSSVMVSLSTEHRTQNQELNSSHQFINWLVAGSSMVLPLFSGNGILSRLSSIFLGFAPPFLLLSIGYEAVFYSALAVVLMAWILFENASHYSSKAKDSSPSEQNTEEHVTIGSEERYLQLSDVRIPLIFMVLFNVAFFGTGNFASIASFEISSVYRFITIFSVTLSDGSSSYIQALHTVHACHMCVQCNNEISESAKTGMLLPCDLIFRHNDDTFLLPGEKHRKLDGDRE
ncbi:hypothetical protein Bca101_084972 [Brassica carinata]